MQTLVLCLLLFQNVDYAPAARASAEATQRETALREVATALTGPATPSASEQSARQYAAAHDEAFVEKFNALINRLMDFSDSYKTRNAIDVKKAAAIRAAWLELEKSEALFRDQTKK